MEKVASVSKSFAEADRADKLYYRSLGPGERLQILFEMNRRWNESVNGGPPPRLERVYRVIKFS